MGSSQRARGSNTSSKNSFTLDELFKRGHQQRQNALEQVQRIRKSQQQQQQVQEEEEEDLDLLLALQLSKEEHLNEQKKLLEHFSQLSQSQAAKSSKSTEVTTSAKKKKKSRRIIEDSDEEVEVDQVSNHNANNEDEDDWFETISPRPQLPKYLAMTQQQKAKCHKLACTQGSSSSNIYPITASSDKNTTYNDTSINAAGSKHISQQSISNVPFETATRTPKSIPKGMSSRLKTIVKKEWDEDEVVIDIDDMSEWLKVKDEDDTDKEEEDGILLDIDDMSAWLDVKDEESAGRKNEGDSFIIDDFTAFLNENDSQMEDAVDTEKRHGSAENSIPIDFNMDGHSQKSVISINDDDDDGANSNKNIAESDIEDGTDCSVIDLVDPSNNTQKNSQPQQTETVEEDNDGYLSPLEGFTDLDQSNAEFAPFFEQFQASTSQTPKKRTRKATIASSSSKSGTRKRKSSSSKWPANKRKRYFGKHNKKKRS